MVGSSLFFLASLLLVASVGFAQDPGKFNCSDFTSQQEAQGFYEENDPRSDPYILDSDSDGIACESLQGADDDSGTAPAPEDEDGADLGEQRTAPGEQNDSSVSANQYQQEEIVTPDTGGPALLPLAGAATLFISSGYLLLRR